MKPDAYASLAAFLAHRRALKHADAGALDPEELARSAKMEKIIASLRPEERATLDAANSDDGSADHGTMRRRRERAELRLGRELRARGWLAM